MTTETFDPIELYARLNPFPRGLTADPLERDATLARIRTRRDAPCRSSRRRIAAAVVASVALAVPALAFSGTLDSLFGFSNHGTPVRSGDLSHATATLRLTGARPHTLVQLASRGGWTVYGARTPSGELCFYDGPTKQELGGGCMNAAASARFPSASDPVYDMSLFELAPGSPAPSVSRLAGVAADGVASVEVLALDDCRVVARTPVSDNVYLASGLPSTPEAQIVARDSAGTVVWHEAVGPGNNGPSCGLR
jgi:hypothetical protein